MDTKTMLSALEEELLYVLYDNHLLKKCIMKFDKLSVSFDIESTDVSVLSFSLIIVTDKEQKLILQSGNASSFVQTLQTYKRLETEMEDWGFLDDSLRELSEELPRYEELIRQKIEEFYTSRFSSDSFIPLKYMCEFESGEEECSYNKNALSHMWTLAWKRFASQKRNYFSYLGFKGERYQELAQMQLLSLIESEVEVKEIGTLTKVSVKALYKQTPLTLTFYTNKSLLVETHMFVNHVLDKDDSSLNGTTLGDFFEIEQIHGYDLEKQIKQFLNRESVMYQESLECFKKETLEQLIGLSVTNVYEENGIVVYELSDGTKVRKV